MSDDPILAALARLEAGQAALRGELRDRFDHLEGKIDKLAAENDLIRPRLTGIEQDVAGRDVRTATAHARLDAQEVRLSLIERRLELRDRT